jgi:hypothetical protein
MNPHRFFFENFSGKEKNSGKNFTEHFRKKNSTARHKNPSPLIPPHAVNPLQKPPLRNHFFRIRTIPNPAPKRAPIPNFPGTKPYTSPDWDPPTPCLVRNSWKFFTNRGSGCLSNVGARGKCIVIRRKICHRRRKFDREKWVSPRLACPRHIL